MYGVVPYISREDCIEASQADSLTTMVSRNRQNRSHIKLSAFGRSAALGAI
jgi:hypothetical protein